MVFDKAKFRVQANILVQMPGRIVRLSSEYGADLEDALKDANHDLFIELRALSEVSWSAKAVQLEHVRPALSGRGDDLRGLDLGKAARQQRTTKARHCPVSETQNGPSRRMAVGNNGVIKQRAEASRDLALVERDRRHLTNGRDDFDLQLMQFVAARSLGLAHDQPFNLDDAFNASIALGQRNHFSLGLSNRLHQPPAVANDKKVDATQQPERV